MVRRSTVGKLALFVFLWNAALLAYAATAAPILSDAMSVQLITASFAFVTLLANLIMAYMTLRLTKVSNDTHTLVNKNMGVQLRYGADLAEFKAKTTKKSADVAAAALARHMYEEHVKQQAKVDSGSGNTLAMPPAPSPAAEDIPQPTKKKRG